jgi:hypothetical protein
MVRRDMDDQMFGDWAEEMFGGAALGDPRRTARLISMAATAARNPAGKVTQVFQSSAEREGAFRLLENDAVPSARVSEAVFDAAAAHCAEQTVVFVALDATTLSLTDRKGRRQLGRVGPRFPTRGLHVMSALAVDRQGAAIGLVEQCWWARTGKVRAKRKRSYDCRYQEKETRYWVDTLRSSHHRMREAAPTCRAWYQLDRGADSWPVLKFATEHKLLITVRSAYPRRLRAEDGSRQYLREELKKCPILGEYTIRVPARPNRPARIARIAVRARPVTIDARVTVGNRRYLMPFNAVSAQEIGYRGKDRINWILLTTAPAATFAEAREVVAGYASRWKVEEFHRTWKRGLCRVEDNQLQSRSAIVKWATILAAVAVRSLRLAKLIRTSPDIPASEEFTEYEIDAAFILLKKKRDRRRSLTLYEVMDLVADIGGFTHKYDKAHPLPGPTVIGRGLERVRILALGLENMADLR